MIDGGWIWIGGFFSGPHLSVFLWVTWDEDGWGTHTIILEVDAYCLYVNLERFTLHCKSGRNRQMVMESRTAFPSFRAVSPMAWTPAGSQAITAAKRQGTWALKDMTRDGLIDSILHSQSSQKTNRLELSTLPPPTVQIGLILT